MNKLRIISFVLALIMSIQILPLAELGNALGNNLWTEELPHGTCEDTGKTEFSIKTFLPTAPHQFISDIICNSANIYIHISEENPVNHSTDVETPPPDALS
jgi:hypothetical protein